MLHAPRQTGKTSCLLALCDYLNALGYEVTSRMKEKRDRCIRIIPEMIYRAQEQIIYRCDTHIDILIDKLREDRVRRVIGPILANED